MNFALNTPTSAKTAVYFYIKMNLFIDFSKIQKVW